VVKEEPCILLALLAEYYEEKLKLKEALLKKQINVEFFDVHNSKMIYNLMKHSL